MSFLSERLYPASFKGVEFHQRDVSMPGGPKTAVQEYPNKKDRSIEDLGTYLRTFTFDAIIQGFFYDVRKRQLEAALNDASTPGIYMHPYLGPILCKCTGYTLSETDSALGVASYNLTLLEVGKSVYPNVDPDIRTQIADFYRKIYDFMAKWLDNQYILEFTRNAPFAANKANSIINAMKATLGTVESSGQISARTEFNQKSKLLSENVYQVVSRTGVIGTNLAELMGLFDGVANNAQDRYDASSQIIAFGSDETFLDSLSGNIVERNNNLKSINSLINVLAFSNLADAAKDISYANELQLNVVANELDLHYTNLLNSEYNLLTDDVQDQLGTIKTSLRLFFDQKRQVVSKIIVIRTEETPVAVLSYQYYGDVDEYDQILTLNNSFNPSVISGEVKILEQ